MGYNKDEIANLQLYNIRYESSLNNTNYNDWIELSHQCF